ncbi:hypothetical protein ACOMHN_036104 [Nucella lapillus]
MSAMQATLLSAGDSTAGLRSSDVREGDSSIERELLDPVDDWIRELISPDEELSSSVSGDVFGDGMR